MLIYQRPWTQQPQSLARVNWANPISRGLLFCMQNSGGGFADATLRMAGVKRDTAAAVQVGTPLGVALDFLGTSQIEVAPASDTRFDLSGEMTMLVLCTPDNTAGGTFGQYPFGQGNDSATLSQGAIRVKGLIGGYWGSNLIVEGATTLSNGVSVLIGFSRNGSTGSWSATVWLNGFSDGSASTTINPSAQQLLALGNVGNAPGYSLSFDGRVHAAWLWNRPLSSTEHVSLAANLWQLFAPLPRRLWVPQFGAPPAPPVGTLGQFDPELRLAAWF